MDPNTVETCHFVNSFAPWLAAFGTLAALITSLYLATKQTKAKLRVSAAHHLTAWTGAPLKGKILKSLEDSK
jgi:hypothetical protein